MLGPGNIKKQTQANPCPHGAYTAVRKRAGKEQRQSRGCWRAREVCTKREEQAGRHSLPGKTMVEIEVELKLKIGLELCLMEWRRLVLQSPKVWARGTTCYTFSPRPTSPLYVLGQVLRIGNRKKTSIQMWENHTDNWGKDGKQEKIWDTRGKKQNSKEIVFMNLNSKLFPPSDKTEEKDKIWISGLAQSDRLQLGYLWENSKITLQGSQGAWVFELSFNSNKARFFFSGLQLYWPPWSLNKSSKGFFLKWEAFHGWFLESLEHNALAGMWLPSRESWSFEQLWQLQGGRSHSFTNLLKEKAGESKFKEEKQQLWKRGEKYQRFLENRIEKIN